MDDFTGIARGGGGHDPNQILKKYVVIMEQKY